MIAPGAGGGGANDPHTPGRSGGPDPSRLPERDRAMTARVLREARDGGVDPEGCALIERALDTAMIPRRARLADDHHPAFLHPGRTVLLLLHDTPERDPVTLAAAALVESWEPELRVESDTVARDVGGPVAETRDAVPHQGPADERLEALVVAPIPLARVGLAETLDHLRHLHLEPNMNVRRSRHAQAVEIQTPVAARVDPVLSRRFIWWTGMFARRHLDPAPTSG